VIARKAIFIESIGLCKVAVPPAQHNSQVVEKALELSPHKVRITRSAPTLSPFSVMSALASYAVTSHKRRNCERHTRHVIEENDSGDTYMMEKVLPVPYLREDMRILGRASREKKRDVSPSSRFEMCGHYVKVAATLSAPFRVQVHAAAPGRSLLRPL
jgi:hypothetical protein